MSAKVDTTSAVESPNIKMSGTTNPSTAPTSSQKVSKFAAKSGFVIPRNKLSGSLIPIFRGGKKLGVGDAVNEESTKLVQRKTKWGPDLTEDAAVKKGRALAYQTRVDQITQQLKLGSLDVGDTQDLPIAAENPDHRSPSPQSNRKTSELLELEKREVIGELLKLNPSYKVPPDYKPLLKESRVPIPVKEYPGFNFIGLIFGPGGDNKKRLEKETGAKIQVYGIKAKTGEKGEIKPSDGNEIQGAYEELYVHILAETYEKVDAGVSIIELLVASVSGNLGLGAVSTTSTSVSGDNVYSRSQIQDAATSHIVPTAVINQGTVQPVSGPPQTGPQGQFRFPGPWFPSGQSISAMHAPSGLIHSPNLSAPILNNPFYLSSSPFNPSNMPSLFGPPPVPPRPQPPTQVLQHPYMAQTSPLGHLGPLRNPSMPALQPSSAQPNVSAPLLFTGSLHPQTRPPPVTGPLIASFPQPLSSVPPGSIPDRPVTHARSSIVWSGAPAGASASTSLGLSNMGQMAPRMVPPHGPHPQNPRPGVASAVPPSNLSTANMVSPVIFPSRPSTPQLSGTAVNRPSVSPHFASNPPPQLGHPPALSASLHQTPAPAPTPLLNSSINPRLGSAPIPLPGSSTQLHPPLQPRIPNSVAGSTANFTPLKPPTVIAPSSGDFTFQPHRPQNPVSQTVMRSSNQSVTQSTSQVQPPLPQAPSFRLAVPQVTPQPVTQVFRRPQVSNPVGLPQAHVSAVPYAGSPTAISGPPRHPAFPNASHVTPRAPLPQMGPRNFSPSPQMSTLPGPIPPRPGNTMQLQQNYPAHTTRPEILLAPNQQFSNNLSFASGKPVSSPGGQQIYDPFSPTSVSTSKVEERGNH